MSDTKASHWIVRPAHIDLLVHLYHFVSFASPSILFFYSYLCEINMTRRKRKTPQQRRFYKNLIHNCLVQTYRRMEDMVSTLPMNGVDLDKDTPESRTIRNVLAIEQEWILDPDLRAELSLIDLGPPPDTV